MLLAGAKLTDPREREFNGQCLATIIPREGNKRGEDIERWVFNPTVSFVL
jgi:hypothetical protein